MRTVSLAPRQLDLYYNFIHVMGNEVTFLAQNFPFRYLFDYPHSDVLGKVVSRKVLGSIVMQMQLSYFPMGLQGLVYI